MIYTKKAGKTFALIIDAVKNKYCQSRNGGSSLLKPGQFTRRIPCISLQFLLQLSIARLDEYGVVRKDDGGHALEAAVDFLHLVSRRFVLVDIDPVKGNFEFIEYLFGAGAIRHHDVRKSLFVPFIFHL